jgi:hypothetical protein
MECIDCTVTPFSRNSLTAATGSTRSWFVCLISSLEDLWSRLILYGMLVFCFFLSLCCHWYWVKVVWLRPSFNNGNQWQSWQWWQLFALFILIVISFLILLSRMVEFGWISDSIWARPQEANSLRHPNPKYHGKTLCCPGRRYWDYSSLSEHSLPWGTWRLQAGFRRWLYYVVCQLVGYGMVLCHLWYVMKSDWCAAQSNLAKGAKQKITHYFTYVHYSHYLLKK